jgi:glycosyltransferase 2 family protein
MQLKSTESIVENENVIAVTACSPQVQPSIPRRAINIMRQIRHSLPKPLKLKLKILFSVALFASLPLFLKIDPQKTLAVITQTNLWVLAATAFVVVATTALNARRWQILAGALGINKPFLELAQYYYVGMFFNLFLPSTVGGDFSRCYYVSKGTGRYKDALYSVLADRAAGVAVLCASASAGILLSPQAKELPLQLKLPILAGAFGLFAVMPYLPVITRRLLGDHNWIARQFNNSNAQIFWRDKSLVAAAMAWSVFIQVIMVSCHFGVAAALGIASKMPLWYYFVFYPCVAVLGFVTPSFNGLGIREWAYTYFLMLMGVDRAAALSYALAWLLLTTLLSWVGGLVYVVARLTPPPQDQDDS